jgi:two-component system, OmpR family, response regulator
MTMGNVLLIDDDEELSTMLADYISMEGFDVTVENDSEQGLARVLKESFDIVVLDIMMPKMDGIEVLRRIREKRQVPVLMLTAKGDDDYRILGLELGADDYVPKPCKAREVVARLRAILKRTLHKDHENEVIRVGQLAINPNKRTVTWGGDDIVLTSTEFNLLEVLAKNAGKIVRKEELSLSALDRPLSKYDRSIDVHMSSIRQKLSAKEGEQSSIQTIYRLGYQLVKN